MARVHRPGPDRRARSKKKTHFCLFCFLLWTRLIPNGFAAQLFFLSLTTWNSKVVGLSLQPSAEATTYKEFLALDVKCITHLFDTILLSVPANTTLVFKASALWNVCLQNLALKSYFPFILEMQLSGRGSLHWIRHKEDNLLIILGAFRTMEFVFLSGDMKRCSPLLEQRLTLL